jgi:hypothetical protein
VNGDAVAAAGGRRSVARGKWEDADILVVFCPNETALRTTPPRPKPVRQKLDGDGHTARPRKRWRRRVVHVSYVKRQHAYINFSPWLAHFGVT